jgi:hypothetical protein
VRRLLPALLAVVLSAAACSDGKPDAQPTPQPSRSVVTVSPCPVPSLRPALWPPDVPADLPKPEGAVIEKVERAPNNVTVIRFSTPTSLSEGVIHVVKQFPRQGYQIGRGDAEVSEADAPFQKGNLRGLVRLLAQQQCKTLWLLAIGTGGDVPFAPGYSPPASSSPLPFG